jgi:hypothetical protein
MKNVEGVTPNGAEIGAESTINTRYQNVTTNKEEEERRLSKDNWG